MATRNVSFYTNKITSYFLQMESTDLMSVTDTVFRHGQIKSQLTLMDGIQGILGSISSYLKRNKKGYYFLLQKFEDRVEVYRTYVHEFKTEELEESYQPAENEMQFTLMSRINRYEDFIEKELEYEPPKPELANIEIQGNASLSLADLKLV
jgi:hypothetical protein